MNDYKVIAFDLDGTLTQHKTKLEPQNRAVLDALRARYRLLMVGAGGCMRIFHQMGEYPIDIIGNYGMQYGVYRPEKGTLEMIRDDTVPCDREKVAAAAAGLRERYGWFPFAGEPVEYHPSGCVTLPLIGTAAKIEDKLAYDPDRTKRRAVYDEVCAAFPDYHVFVGGSSSFDMAPKPYNKYFALSRYGEEQGLTHAQILYVGDDYGPGGNDESVYTSDFPFICVSDYRNLPELLAPLLEE